MKVSDVFLVLFLISAAVGVVLWERQHEKIETRRQKFEFPNKPVSDWTAEDHENSKKYWEEVNEFIENNT